MNERLTKSAWLDHGLRVLASKGAGGFKVGLMASGLGVSRGSFYWHFADLAGFESELIVAWEDASTSQVFDSSDPTGWRVALEHLIHRSLADDRALDHAMRGWALQNERVAERLALVDERRIAHICALLTRCGLEDRVARMRGKFLYWSYLGRPGAQVDEPEIKPFASAMVEMLLD